MTLKQWLANRWLVKHETTKDEIAALISVVERDLRDAAVEGVSPDWRLAIAYNAGLQCAITALAASGYRPSKGGAHHYYAIEALRFTLGVDENTIRVFDAFRKKRNIADYERAGTVTNQEVKELVELSRELRDRLVHWLQEHHPNLLKYGEEL
jgi:hypothetical protein